MKFYLLLLVGIFSLSLHSCKTAEHIKPSETVVTTQYLISSSPIFNKIFTGFLLFDPVTGNTIAKQYEDKYFTPASNTKIFTMHACNQFLGDSIPSLRYVIQGDSLIFWGTGDPTFAHTTFETNFGKNNAVAFLKNWKGQLFYAPQFNKNRFGAGWAWDDYNEAYAPELSTFPIYANIIRFRKTKGSTKPTTMPLYFEQFLKQEKGLTEPIRNEIDNRLNYPPYAIDSIKSKDIPFRVSNEVVLKLIEEATEKNVHYFWNLNAAMKSKQRTIYSYRTNDLLQQMMYYSDNFMAEQLLFVCASELRLPLETKPMITFAVDSLLKKLPDAPIWEDGSGTSRYNMFTPRSVVYVLNELYQDINTETLFTIFPSGGKTGNLKNSYAGNPPYVFAKTGTLTNNHCLSGYIKTNSGKILIFSFMNNHYTGTSAPYKAEMQRILEWIRDNE